MKTQVFKFLGYASIVMIVVGCLYVLRPGFVQYRKHRNEVKRLEAEISELEAERARLEEQVRALEEQDPEYIEKLAREKHHLGMPGETIFRFK